MWLRLSFGFHIWSVAHWDSADIQFIPRVPFKLPFVYAFGPLSILLAQLFNKPYWSWISVSKDYMRTIKIRFNGYECVWKKELCDRVEIALRGECASSYCICQASHRYIKKYNIFRGCDFTFIAITIVNMIPLFSCREMVPSLPYRRGGLDCNQNAWKFRKHLIM